MNDPALTLAAAGKPAGTVWRIPQRRTRAALHCLVLADPRCLAQAQPAGLVRALRAGGVCVTVSDPTDAPLDAADPRWLRSVDVVVARGHSPDLLARLGMAEAAGVATVNRRRAIAAALDKAQMATQLHAARIPAPATWIGSIEQLRRHLRPEAFPLVIKPVSGASDRDVAVVESPGALAALRWSERGAIAQRLLPGDGFDITLYVIGDSVCAVRRPSALCGRRGAVTPLAVAPRWRELALRCGEVFGLHLYGVDCIEADGGLQVVDVNDFPDYGGVADADAMLARHVERQVTVRRLA